MNPRRNSCTRVEQKFSRNKEVSYCLLKSQNFKCCFDVEGNKSGRPGGSPCVFKGTFRRGLAMHKRKRENTLQQREKAEREKERKREREKEKQNAYRAK